MTEKGEAIMHNDTEDFIRKHVPFINKPRKQWTDDERQQFNAVMEALFTGRALAIHEEIIRGRGEK